MQQREINHIFERLRSGLVPELGLEAFAVGIERQRAEVHRQLDMVADGEGQVKFLRGGYGCGKTFLARLAILDAQARGYATSFVVVSDNDLRFHKFDELYHKVVTELSTDVCPRGALGDILDRWVGSVEEALEDAGIDEDSEDFDATVRARLSEDVLSKTEGKAPEDFVRALQAIFDAKQEGALSEASGLISWLSGSRNVAASAKRRAGVKGEVTSAVALSYLSGIVEIIKAAGYKGLVIVIDEAETLLRSRSDVRGKAMNGLRQLCDRASQYKGLLWLITGTPEFFDARRGVAGLAPLNDRIKFVQYGGFASLSQPQLQLKPFDAPRLREVALRLRALHPGGSVVEDRMPLVFIERLIEKVTEGFGGDVGVVPRQFLRTLVNHMDLVVQEPGYDPMAVLGFTVSEADRPPVTPDDGDDDLMAVEDVW
ncbi:MAG: hypothetical protein ACI8RZ_006518 [Myxococcota bacterium]|jgi:hypothetical protein